MAFTPIPMLDEVSVVCVETLLVTLPAPAVLVIVSDICIETAPLGMLPEADGTVPPLELVPLTCQVALLARKLQLAAEVVVAEEDAARNV